MYKLFIIVQINVKKALLNKPVAQFKKRPSSRLEFIDDEDF